VHDRQLLGPADVTDDELAALVARDLGRDPAGVRLLDSTVEVVDYDLDALTTAGRFWVAGHVATPDGTAAFRVFVKHVQSWSRSPLFAAVPEEVRAMAEVGVPWRTEPLVYRSDLATRLPEGLEMPRALGVVDLDEKAASIWLAEVPVHPWPWDLPRCARAAHLLGRLAASTAVAPLACVGEHPWSVHDYLHGRLEHQVLPMLEDDGLWQHPLVAGSFDGRLRERLLAAAARVPAYVEELARVPHLTGHGDACPNNLLGTADPDTFVLIDYGFWMSLPLGFDLGQLLVGDVQLGRRPASSLAETEARIVPAYVAGLAAEGLVADEDEVRRAHAVQLLVFCGLSCLPFEHLDEPPGPALRALAADRAALARFSLDLVEATGG
jgi:hypothetical protein